MAIKDKSNIFILNPKKVKILYKYKDSVEELLNFSISPSLDIA